MNDHDHIDRSLLLLAKRGTYEALRAMSDRGGAATFTQITAEARHALTMLRALAAEGFVMSAHCGSLDIEPPAQTTFMLTAKGEAVIGHLTRLQPWITSRPKRRGSHYLLQ